MKKSILILVVFLTFACNQDKTFSKAVLKNEAGVEYCVILPNTYQKQNIEITQNEIEKTDKFVVKAFDSLVHDIESTVGQKITLKLSDYKRQYIPSLHRIVRINGLMEPIRIDWRKTIYSGGGGGWRYFTGEFNLETGKGVLAFNGAL